MIVLNNDVRSLEYLLGGAVTTAQLPFVVNYVNTSREGQQHQNSNNGTSNNTTAVTILGAPPAGGKRTIQSLSIRNADTVSATVTVRLNDNGTFRSIPVITLAVGDQLIYTSAAGWFVLTSTGFIKSTSTAVNLDDLGDVSITSPAIGATLIYNGTNWIDGQLDLADADATTGVLPAAQCGSRIQLGAEVASTSGTSIDFTGIPAGVRRITIMFVGVSTNGTSNPLIQIGDAGGIETTGYTGGAANDSASVRAQSAAGFVVHTIITAAATTIGFVTLNLEDSTDFTWMIGGDLYHDTVLAHAAGSKALSAELDRVRITTVNGTDTFDAGTINISYEDAA